MAPQSIQDKNSINCYSLLLGLNSSQVTMAILRFISIFLLSLSISSIDGSILKENKIGSEEEHFIAAVYEHEPVKGAAVCYEKGKFYKRSLNDH